MLSVKVDEVKIGDSWLFGITKRHGVRRFVFSEYRSGNALEVTDKILVCELKELCEKFLSE